MFGRRTPRTSTTPPTSYYDILGVPKECSADELKKAYRKAAIKNHPDKGGDPEKFKELAQAYEVLSDPEQRRMYDQYGEDALKEGMSSRGPSMNPFDIFESFFSFGAAGFPFAATSSRGVARKIRGEDVVHHLKVSLEELYSGASRKLSLMRNVICPRCKGKGSKPGGSRRCPGCRGQGMKTTIRRFGPMIQQMQHICPECKGSGESIAEKDRCTHCKGGKVIQQRKVLEVNVERGMRHGRKIVFTGEADQAPGIEPGDIVFVLEMKDHSNFKRKGDDLFTEHTISLTEALCGFQFVLTHLDGRHLLIKSNIGEVTKSGQCKSIYHEGMPQYGRPFVKGDLYILFIVEFPESGSLNADQCRALKAILPMKAAVIEVSDMDLDECEEALLCDVDIKEEMSRKKRLKRCDEACEEEEDSRDEFVECAQM